MLGGPEVLGRGGGEEWGLNAGDSVQLGGKGGGGHHRTKQTNNLP
jgi:hypothetical protein